MTTGVEFAPTISYGRSISKRVGVNLGRLMAGIDGIGLLPETSVATSIHFNPKSDRLGDATSSRWIDQFMFRTPYFRERTFLMMGYSLDQADFKHKVAVQADPDRTPSLVRQSLSSQDNIRKRDLNKISDADCIGLILAHELQHVLNHQGKERRFFVPRNEAAVRAYVAECVKKGKHSPWAGVVKIKY